MLASANHRVPPAVVLAVDRLVEAFEVLWSIETHGEASFDSFKSCWADHVENVLKFSKIHVATANSAGFDVRKLAERKWEKWETGDEDEQELQALYTAAIRLLDPEKPFLRRVGGLFFITCLYFSLPPEMRTPVRVTPAGWHNLLGLCQNARPGNAQGRCMKDVGSAFMMLHSAAALVLSATPFHMSVLNPMRDENLSPAPDQDKLRREVKRAADFLGAGGKWTSLHERLPLQDASGCLEQYLSAKAATEHDETPQGRTCLVPDVVDAGVMQALADDIAAHSVRRVQGFPKRRRLDSKAGRPPKVAGSTDLFKAVEAAYATSDWHSDRLAPQGQRDGVVVGVRHSASFSQDDVEANSTSVARNVTAQKAAAADNDGDDGDGDDARRDNQVVGGARVRGRHKSVERIQRGVGAAGASRRQAKSHDDVQDMGGGDDDEEEEVEFSLEAELEAELGISDHVSGDGAAAQSPARAPGKQASRKSKNSDTASGAPVRSKDKAKGKAVGKQRAERTGDSQQDNETQAPMKQRKRKKSQEEKQSEGERDAAKSKPRKRAGKRKNKEIEDLMEDDEWEDMVVEEPQNDTQRSNVVDVQAELRELRLMERQRMQARIEADQMWQRHSIRPGMSAAGQESSSTTRTDSSNLDEHVACDKTV